MDDRHDPRPGTEDEDGAFGLDPSLVAEVREAVEAGEEIRLDALLSPLHPADIADLLEQIDPRVRRALLAMWTGMDGEILTELDVGLREEVVEALDPAELASVVRELESDDVVDLVEDLDAESQQAILDVLPASDRAAVEKALAYPEFSAGRLMQVEVARAPEHWTVGEAIDHLRSGATLPDQFYHLVLVDPRMRPVGQATLGRILAADRATRLRDIMEEEGFRPFHVETGQDDVAQAFNKYHLISSPVVDDHDRLLGVITIDDAMIVLDEENEEDILRLAGVGDGALSDSVWETVKGRLPWLLVNLGTAGLAALVIAQFEGSLQALVALAVLMPIVASMGGNAGTQSLTVAVRALATRDLTSSNSLRVVRREALVGLLNGATLAVLLGLGTALLFGSLGLGAVIATALVVNLLVASLAGVLVPLALERFGVDPALASGTFVTTITDVVGFFAFLGLATVVLL